MSTFEVKQIGSRLAEARPRSYSDQSPCAACTVRSLTLCSALERDELSHLTAIVTSVELAAGDGLFEDTDDATHIFNITAGVIKVYKLLPDGRRQVTGFLFPGDFIGLERDGRYAYGAEAVTHTTLCRFRRKQLAEVFQRFPKLERRLLELAWNEMVADQEQMVLLGRKTARERIASFLLLLSSRAVQRGQKANPINVPMSRNDMADHLGLTTETVSRVVTSLRRQGAIALPVPGKIEIVDRSALEEMSGDL